MAFKRSRVRIPYPPPPETLRNPAFLERLRGFCFLPLKGTAAPEWVRMLRHSITVRERMKTWLLEPMYRQTLVRKPLAVVSSIGANLNP